ncbi:MAG: YlxR family protein [Pseudonocardiaceae bacterium]
MRPAPVLHRPPVHARIETVSRQGTAHSRREPVRTCVGCRTRTAASGLLRVVVVDGTLVPDRRRRLPGRGAWLHPDPGCLRTAERRRAFPRALRVAGTLDTAAVHEHLAQPSEPPGPRPAVDQHPASGDFPEAGVTENERQVDPTCDSSREALSHGRALATGSSGTAAGSISEESSGRQSPRARAREGARCHQQGSTE